MAAFIGLAVVPLVLHVLYFYAGLKNSEAYLRAKAAAAMNRQASYMLSQVARTAADRVTALLNTAVSDTRTLALAEPSAQTYVSFFNTHNGQVWTVNHGRETRWDIPMYPEIAFIGIDGRELVRIVDGKVSSMLRDVSDPSNTDFHNGDYFQQIMSAPDGEIYVSRLEGRHVYSGEYKGVYRFGCRVQRDGRTIGVLVLSMDQKLFSEIISHIEPNGAQVAASPYHTGSYAFLFDDQGWITAHPMARDVRGYNENNQLENPLEIKNGRNMMRDGRLPFNLLYAGYIHPNYVTAAANVRMGRSGVIDVTNVGGIDKLMAYTPVFFSQGVYAEKGIFGGVTVGAEAGQFHKAARVTSEAIRFEFRNYIEKSWAFVSLVLLVVIFVGYKLAVGVVRPIELLAEGTRRMATGRLDTEVKVMRKDEIGQLASSFNSMGRKLLEQREYLESSLDQLERSQQDLLWEQVFKSTVFENINIGIITINNDSMVTFINSAAKNIFGMVYTDEGTALDELTSRCPNLDAVMKEVTSMPADGKLKRFADIERPDGKKSYVLSMAPLIVGSYIGRVITIEDITERVSMRTQMERMERLASLGRLSAGLAHEIRNPLTGVSILLDDMHDRLLDMPEEQELIRRSLSEIERLETLVNELLSFARVSEPTMLNGSVVEVLDDVLFMMSPQCEKAGIHIERLVEDGIPDFLMDSDKLKQAFINLIKNAVEAMPDGGTLTVAVAVEGGAVRVSIKDTGEGMPEERIPFIFEPFYTSKGGGTGLGLAITHNIITDHKAEISVTSTTGKGTEFIIIFPL